MTVTATITNWQDKYFEFVKKIEAPVVQRTGQFADTIAGYVPTRPTFMADMPTTKEFVDQGLKFRRRMVDEQATFVHHMLKAIDPVLERVDMVDAPHPTHAPKAATDHKAPAAKPQRPAVRKVA